MQREVGHSRMEGRWGAAGAAAFGGGGEAEGRPGERGGGHLGERGRALRQHSRLLGRLAGHAGRLGTQAGQGGCELVGGLLQIAKWAGWLRACGLKNKLAQLLACLDFEFGYGGTPTNVYRLDFLRHAVFSWVDYCK